MVKDAVFAYDAGGVKEIFRKILDEAEKSGIFYDEEEGTFRLRRRGRVVFSLGH